MKAERSESRWSQRVPFRHDAKIGHENPPGRISFITDISEGGVCLKTNTAFSPGTKVYLAIAIESTSYEAEGVVVWAEKAPPELTHQIRGGMGIKFTRIDKGLIDVYNNTLEQVNIHVEPEQ
jgi:Tfp pilus assembly protein PilZ